MSHLLVAWLLLGCSDDSSVQTPEPSFIQVAGTLGAVAEDTAEAPLSTPEDELPFSSEDRAIHVTGQTLDRHADPYPYTGWVEVGVRPGTLVRVDGGQAAEGSDEVPRWFAEVQDGEIDLNITIRSGFGPTRVWVSAVAGPEDDRKGGSFATGVTEAFPFALPSIAQLQTTDNHETNPLYKEYVTLRTDDRQVVVSALTTNGFWASDLDDAPGDFSGIFVYTFNKPDEVSVGQRVTLLAGGSEEYIGATQLGFPLYETEQTATLQPPPAIELDDTTFCSGSQPEHLKLEALESSLVTLPSGTIPSEFQAPADPTTLDQYSDEAQYIEYGQWPVDTAGGCRFYVVSNTTVPDFDAFEHSGEDVGPISGMLSYASAGGDIWILLVRGPEDLPAAGSSTSHKGAQGPPAPTPRRFHRSRQPVACGHDHTVSSH